jgi:hypothetical protein
MMSIRSWENVLWLEPQAPIVEEVLHDLIDRTKRFSPGKLAAAPGESSSADTQDSALMRKLRDGVRLGRAPERLHYNARRIPRVLNSEVVVRFGDGGTPRGVSSPPSAYARKIGDELTRLAERVDAAFARMLDALETFVGPATASAAELAAIDTAIQEFRVAKAALDQMLVAYRAIRELDARGGEGIRSA